MKLNESVLEEAVLTWFDELGYTVRNGLEIAPDAPDAERSDFRQVVLVERLRARLQPLNPNVPAAAIEDVISQITVPNVPTLIQANKQFHGFVRDGARVEFQRNGETVGDFVRLFDFENPENNDFLAVNQFSVRGARNTKRPDIIIFINGLPVAVIELKNPADVKTNIVSAHRQLETYKADVPDLFNTNELLVIADGREARVGSLTADIERFMTWRTVDGDKLDPLGENNETETLIRGLFRPSLLLEFIRDFVLFEDNGGETVKKIAAYHQFHAVRKAYRSTLAATAPDGDGKIGVVWHTQGSGKSISMAFYAAKVVTSPEMRNPTVVVVTDRNDLDGQLFGVFSQAKELLRETPRQAETRGQLRELLANRPSGGVIFTTIQKFSPFEDEDAYPVLSDRANIVVIADEAHRTQYGLRARVDQKSGELKYGYAYYMREALKNAAFVAFTGTPITGEMRDTRRVFGDYVDIYDMKRSQADHATVPIFYESRLARLHLLEEAAEELDDVAEEVTEDEEESARERLKTRWAALEKVVGADSRLKEIAHDFVRHFDERQVAMARVNGFSGKAMIVCMSREICVRLYDEIIALRPTWHDANPNAGAIKVIMTGASSDKAALRQHIHPKQTKKELEKRFKDANDDFKIAIVRDMWLTGFDAPSLHTIYIDKPMRGHSLMQAIARVNRVFKDKPGGLVVDYIGIGHELKAALREYTATGAEGELITDAAERALPKFLEELSVVRGMLHGFDYQDFETDALELLPDAADHVLGQHDGKQRYSNHVAALTKAFALCCTLDEALRYREEIAFFQAVKAYINKPTATSKQISDERREFALRQIVSRAVVSDEVLDIFATAGLNKPNIGILSEEFLEEVRLMPQRNLAVELLERLLKGEIKTRFGENVVQNRRFSELLAESLNKYHNRAIETVQVIEELIEMAKDFNRAGKRGDDLGLNESELAFYDALEADADSARALGDAVLKQIAVELTENLRKNVTIDWSVRETVRARLRLLVKRILRKHRYPQSKEKEAIELVLQQAETLSDVWTN